MGGFYRANDEVVLNTFGSAKSFKAKVEVVIDGKPTYFRDRNGTLITPADVVSFDFARKTRIYCAECEIITGAVGSGGAWTPVTKLYKFRTEAGLTKGAIEQRARSVAAKRWSTARFLRVLP